MQQLHAGKMSTAIRGFVLTQIWLN